MIEKSARSARRKGRLRVAFERQHAGYENGLAMSVLRVLCDQVIVTSPGKADLIMAGPHRERKTAKRIRMLRQIATSAGSKRTGSGTLRLFDTGENVRHDAIPADYAISMDLHDSKTHFRLPFWMGSLDWSQEAISMPPPRRIARLISRDALLRPIGERVMSRARRGALFSSHLVEPRQALFSALAKVMPTDGYGRAFDTAVKIDRNSNGHKESILAGYQVNLCPENSLYPGYYTEKVVEAYAAGCLPVTWADPNISHDFNPDAIVNALDFASMGYEEGLREALTPQAIKRRSEAPLMLEKPTIEPFVEFMRRVVADALQ